MLVVKGVGAGSVMGWLGRRVERCIASWPVVLDSMIRLLTGWMVITNMFLRSSGL